MATNKRKPTNLSRRIKTRITDKAMPKHETPMSQYETIPSVERHVNQSKKQDPHDEEI